MTESLVLDITTVDAFAAQPFSGNPAAVCVTSEVLPDALMQAIAAEMNLSETAFVYPEGQNIYRLRWFTPSSEVDLCGHATLAAAHVLWERTAVAAGTAITFNTRSGALTTQNEGDLIAMNFPAEPVDFTQSQALMPLITQALGVPVQTAGRNRMDYLAVLDSETDVRRATPDMAAVAALGMRGVIITAQAATGAQYDFVSRCFYPAVGVPEDPVTGSAHCALAPWWAARLNRPKLVGWQASARGGEVVVECLDDRVIIRGTAITVLMAEMQIKNLQLFGL